MSWRIDIASAWRVWAFLALAIAAVHALTLRISPTIWQDEVQIVDYGRATVFERGTDWSVNWHPSGRPIPLFNYLGGALQEGAFRAAGHSMAGPRAASIIGAVFAGCMCLGWLAARGAPPLAALAGALLLLLDPGFVQSYRGARVDCWAVGCCLASAWLLRAQAGQGMGWRWGAAGACAAAGGLFWPSALFMGPLLAAEAWAGTRPGPGRGREAVACAVVFGAAGVVVVAGALLPFHREIQAMLGDLLAVSQQGLHIKPSASFWDRLQWAGFGQAVKLGPWLFVLALPAFWVGRDWPLMLAFGAAAGAILATNAYVHRIVYLLPYGIGLLAGAAAVCARPEAGVWRRRLLAGATGLALGWGVLLTMAARPWLALRQAAGRDPQLLVEAANKAVGPGPLAVYVSPWEFYYAGRQLGWKQYKFPFEPETPASAAWTGLLKRMDCVVFNERDLTAGHRAAITAAGFVSRGRFLEGGGAGAGLGAGGRPYGPVEFFGRGARKEARE